MNQIGGLLGGQTLGQSVLPSQVSAGSWQQGLDPYFCRIKKVENGYIVVVNYREYIVDNLEKLPSILVAAEMTK